MSKRGEPESKTADKVDRRTFIKGVAAAAPAAALGPETRAQQLNDTPPGTTSPSDHEQAMERPVPEGYTREQADRYFVQRPGSDIMVDALRSLGIDYVASNPGSSFRGLQESIATYGGNSQPEFLMCLHEESSVAMAHGYAKAAGKPMAVMCHSTVGLQHAAMAVYNAWCDQIPTIIIAGNHLDATRRRGRVNWAHSAQDPANLVRDFTKWDDAPASMTHFLESLVRAYKIAITPPMGPVVLVADADLQEHDIGDQEFSIPGLSPTSPPQGDANAMREAAALLVNAAHPLIVVDRVARTAAGMMSLVELAETLQAPVIDQLGRMNFPSDHYLNQSSRAGTLIAKADVIIGMELTDMWGTIQRMQDTIAHETLRAARTDVRLISLGTGDFLLRSNYQNFSRYQPVDLAINGDAETSLPTLIEEVRLHTSRRRHSQFAAREDGLRAAFTEMRRLDREAANYAWDASPVTTARLCMEIWETVKSREWSLVSDAFFQGRWPQRLWNMNRHHQYLGGSGGYGVGYGAPAAAGAAIAQREQGIVTVNIQSDGDLLYAPGVLWTAAHHGLPVLSVMHNNRAYHQEVMHIQRMALQRQRGVDGNANIGNTFHEPTIDHAGMARSLGVWSSGPVSNPAELRPALEKALDVVRQGEPALVDVVCQPR